MVLVDMNPPGEDRRDDIIQTAARLFDEVGYAKASMRDLAEAVGIAKPTLYHYFASKDAILHCIHEQFIDILLDRQQRREDAEVPPEQRLRQAMGDILELMHTHRGHVRVFFEHHRELAPAQQRVTRQKRDRYEAMIERAVAEGIARGSIRSVPPRLTALGLFGMCNWAYQWYRADGPMSPGQIADAFWNMLAHGIVTDPAQ